MSRYRSNSSDTIRVSTLEPASSLKEADNTSAKLVTLWVHDDTFSKEEVLVCESVFDGIRIGLENVVEIAALKSASEIRDFEAKDVGSDGAKRPDSLNHGSAEFRGPENSNPRDSPSSFDVDPRTRCLVTVRPLPNDIKEKHPSLQISIHNSIASAFGFRNRSQVVATRVEKVGCTASHVEIGFRDIYLARSDMWRLVESELVGKTVYTGQKISFLGSVRAVVKNIHVRGHRASTAYFSSLTVPVFRSEAARYVLFIQMSREMWDFDSEGNGEILFNRVINGFLPDLFRRWSSIDVRHLVTIVMFGRLEYGVHDFASPKDAESALRHAASGDASVKTLFEDFYRVVVTDMASAKWMTILDELKKDFRVFLRDVSLEHQVNAISKTSDKERVKIRGRLSTAMKGNILEAINIASSQFAHDYIDRDLIRTGISVVVVTAGSGVFEVDRDLLNLTSENLTNNGVGIDVVCLSRMPLHSAPLFKYAVAHHDIEEISGAGVPSSNGIGTGRFLDGNAIAGSLHHQSFPSSTVGSLSRSLSRVPSSVFTRDYQNWRYGIPQWIDLSFWTADTSDGLFNADDARRKKAYQGRRQHTKAFIPRVRMYELQMMGLMELGLANISIPYIKDKSARSRHLRSNLIRKRHGDGQNRNDATRRLSVGVSETENSLKSRADGAEGLLSAHAKQQGTVFQRMDEYDADVFEYRIGARSRQQQASQVKVPLPPNENSEGRAADVDMTLVKEQAQTKAVQADKEVEKKAQQPNKDLRSTPAIPQKPESSRISRSISYALRGLAPPPRAVASTEINVENVQAHGPITIRTPPRHTPTISAATVRSLKSSDNVDAEMARENSAGDVSDPEDGVRRGSPSQPISINVSKQNISQKGRRNMRSSDNTKLRRLPSHLSSTSAQISSTQESESSAVDESENRIASESDHSESSEEEFNPGSVSQDTLPFITNVNASNPVKHDPNAASWFGRWQHLYPRKPKAATVKWRSLCTPASVPLTTEDLPSAEELETDFDSMSYTVSQKEDNDLREIPRSRSGLFSDMVSLRLAHGYQWVVSSSHRRMVNTSNHSVSMIMDDKFRQSDGKIYMTMGSTLQSLCSDGEDSVRVTRYRRKPKQNGEELRKSIEYHPNIRTVLSPSYSTRKMELMGFSEEYPWQLADSYLADTKKCVENAVEKLRFWRARFVLLPVEPPPTAWRLAQSTSENEEEIHLLGIRALTQMWQRQRFIPPQEKTFQKPTIAGRKDVNPLAIVFETLNPSEIVSTELDKLLAAEDAGELQPTQLLPESDLFERETSTLAKLAQAMQGEKGIEIKSRRWHLRLHYNCFQGEEFTNWMLRNFKEGEFQDRADCVEFGNTLMEGGLFTHVNGRHNFKDGNYFYSIAADFRAYRPESRQSWFPSSRRSDRSVPATPVAERTLKETSSSPGPHLRSSSDVEKTDEAQNSPISKGHNSEKNRVSISLSKMIPIDVDHRNRSNKPEVVNLYYDRIHNPENCYRFALTWPPTTTSALVENALASWASLAEKYGLRLVEVPIAEASKINDNEPFRSPYKLSLAIQPPKKGLNGVGNFTSTSFTPLTPPTPDAHLYHKALLKRFNFVLDHEAASEFPSDVDVLLAWGKLEYTMTQYVHRSGVILAQITDDGDFIFLANRLYSTRSSAMTASKFDARKDRGASKPPVPAQPNPAASGILGLNVQNPSPAPSPLVRASADVFGNKAALTASGFATYITPEQIKDELEAFASDAGKLEAFYKEVAQAMPSAPRKSSSSVLRPDKGPDMGIIPEIRLPPSLVTATNVLGMGSGATVIGARKVSPQQQAAEGRSAREESSVERSPKRKNTV